MAANANDAVPDTTFARQKTYPDRLAAATLFGMMPAPVKNCRLREIGCGDGSRFLGIDLADERMAPLLNEIQDHLMPALQDCARLVLMEG